MSPNNTKPMKESNKIKTNKLFKQENRISFIFINQNTVSIQAIL